MSTAVVEREESRITGDEEEKQYLTFVLGDEQYGVNILTVQEIKGYTDVTRIPNTPPYMKGVLNLRGTIVPIINLRMKFGMEQIDFTSFTVIVVVVVQGRVMGMIVDSVSDVLTMKAQDMKPAPALGVKVDTSFIDGIATTGDRLVTLLDIDRVLSDREIEQVEAVASKENE
ncbi:chemotaxis protein CheW [Candidatus Nitronereus thalassa]|uniref:Chemotaxis protein CheW n=1 Tax=Candidatus Nitronereus thalassa TaxID=3020898 RepID=A0ABU3K643_9BACT|nr:chemotaxis protein CheW [Candidatus Nitronereus thalassa]MDT7041894.1 chemotaxis protein CheW [Candidatus Nitronereus thalassa]